MAAYHPWSGYSLTEPKDKESLINVSTLRSSICRDITNLNKKLAPLLLGVIIKEPSASVNPLNHSLKSTLFNLGLLNVL